MKVFVLCILGIITYLLIGIIVSLGVHVAYKYFDFEFLYIDEGEDMLIVFWPLYVIGVILVLPVTLLCNLYEKMVDKIDKAYKETGDDYNE